MIIKFDRDKEWKFKPVLRKKIRADHKKLQYNTDLFGEWIIDLFEKYTSKVDDKFQIYPNIFMNSNNISILREHIGSWEYLNYSPITDDNLRDDELKLNDEVCKKQYEK